MPRKKTNHTIEQVGPELEAQANPEAQEQMAEDLNLLRSHERHLQHIDETYGDNLPYDRHRIENECRFYLQESAISMIEAGKRLVQLKEREPAGSFHESINRIGLAPRAAQKFMQAAVKYSGTKQSLVTVLNRTKLLELISEDDEDLEALAEGGTLAGLNLDEIDRMPSSQLREALRKERQQRQSEQEANERLIAKKDATINEHERRHRIAPTWEKVHFEYANQSGAAALKSIQAMKELKTIFGSIDEIEQQHDLTEDDMRGLAEALQHWMIDLREQFQDTEMEFHAKFQGYLGYADLSEVEIPE